ncbi:MAG: glycosyltransferase, partial [Clostridia bacterium]|nr:glycosyltransferase [Clostridia bacterium]
HDVLQFPVFPIQRMPSLKNIWKGMTSGTYADEFAENHYRLMRMRSDLSAVVPSAGTGFVITHRVLDACQNEPLFPEDSQTEDYKLSLLLAMKGFPVHYVLEKVPRLLDSNQVRWDYVATRSLFPSTFRTAVRQKTRWIYGITMQSVRLADIIKGKNLTPSAKYTIYKDLKAKVGNLLILPGYLVFIYFLVSLFTSVPVMYPLFSFSWWLCVFLTTMMIAQQIKRGVAITNVYGFKSAAVACLLPPIMPIRMVWGNIINFCATCRAWKLFLSGDRKREKGEQKKVSWHKTDHEFLGQSALYRYYRTIGDEFLLKKIVDPVALSYALEQSHKEGIRLGDVLLRDGLVSEEQLMQAVANVQHVLFVKNLKSFSCDMELSCDDLLKYLVYPLIATQKDVVFAITNETPQNTFQELGIDPSSLRIVYTTKDSILNACSDFGRSSNRQHYDFVLHLLRNHRITWEQAVLALSQNEPAPEVLVYMGLLSPFKSMRRAEQEKVRS